MTLDRSDRSDRSERHEAGGPDLPSLIQTLGNLKRIKRTGWVDRGVPPDEVESVADHTLLTALIAWIVARDNTSLDAERVLELALIHDLAEATFGDAPPYEPDEIPDRADAEALRTFFSVNHIRSERNAAAKRIAEDAAMADLLALMPERAREAVSGLWAEYEAQETPEARFVKQVDRLEAYGQARRYAEDHPDLPLWGFTDMAEREIDHPALVALRDAATDDPTPEIT